MEEYIGLIIGYILLIVVSMSIPIVTLVFVIKTYMKVKNIEKNISGQ